MNLLPCGLLCTAETNRRPWRIVRNPSYLGIPPIYILIYIP